MNEAENEQLPRKIPVTAIATNTRILIDPLHLLYVQRVAGRG